MPKKKKTRKQKMLTDVRKQHEPTPSHTVTYEFTKTSKEEPKNAPVASAPLPAKRTHTILTADYKYLPGDLLKTTILTAVIIGLELVLKFVTRV